MTTNHEKMAEPIETPFDQQTRVGPKDHAADGRWGFTLAPPGEYDGSICAAAAATLFL